MPLLVGFHVRTVGKSRFARKPQSAIVDSRIWHTVLWLNWILGLLLLRVCVCDAGESDGFTSMQLLRLSFNVSC